MNLIFAILLLFFIFYFFKNNDSKIFLKYKKKVDIINPNTSD